MWKNVLTNYGCKKTTNELYKAGMTNNQLNLLFIENRNAKVAIKVNNQITRRVNMSNLELQGSVWGNLKCTVSMDKVNKVMLAEDDLTYHYRGDTDIKLLGMIDDTLPGNLKVWNSSYTKECSAEFFYRNPKIDNVQQ